MTNTLPLVRAGALAPFLLWLKDHGRPWESDLKQQGLPESALADPEQPIPLRSGIALLKAIYMREGPDIGCRVGAYAGARHLGLIGLLVASSRTPREAFHKVSRAFSHHGSHEVLTFMAHPGGATVRHVFRVALDAEALFHTQQYTAALIASAAVTGPQPPAIARVELTPHPVFGLAPVAAHLACPLAPSVNGAVAVTLDDAVLDQPYPDPPSVLDQQFKDGCAVIRGDGTLSGSIRAVLPQLLAQGREPTLAHVAALAYLSTRTLQRRLTAEGTSLSRLTEEERARRALQRLTSSTTQIQAVAQEMGYGSGASFTRAVRRWTAKPPTHLRKADSLED